MESRNFFSHLLSMALVALLTALPSSSVWANQLVDCVGIAEGSLERAIESLPRIEGLVGETTPTFLVKQQGSSKKIVVLMQVKGEAVFSSLIEKLKEIDEIYLRPEQKSRRETFHCSLKACFMILGGILGVTLPLTFGITHPAEVMMAASVGLGFGSGAGGALSQFTSEVLRDFDPFVKSPKLTQKAIKRFLDAPTKDTQVMFLLILKETIAQIGPILQEANAQHLNGTEVQVVLDQMRTRHGLLQEKQAELARQNQEDATQAKLRQEGLVKQDGDAVIEVSAHRILGQVNSSTHQISLRRLMPSPSDVSVFLNALPDLALLGYKDAKRVLANKSVFFISTFSTSNHDRSLGLLFFEDGRAVVRFHDDIPPEKVEEIKNRIYASLEDYQHVNPNYHPQNIDDGLVIAASVKQMDAHEKLLTNIAADLNEAPEAPVERVRVRQ